MQKRVCQLLYSLVFFLVSNQPCLQNCQSHITPLVSVRALPLLVLGVLAANDVDVFATLSTHTLQVVISVYCPSLLLVLSWIPASLLPNCPYLATITQLLDGTSDLHSSCLLESNQALCGRCDGSDERHLRHSRDERVG